MDDLTVAKSKLGSAKNDTTQLILDTRQKESLESK